MIKRAGPLESKTCILEVSNGSELRLNHVFQLRIVSLSELLLKNWTYFTRPQEWWMVSAECWMMIDDWCLMSAESWATSFAEANADCRPPPWGASSIKFYFDKQRARLHHWTWTLGTIDSFEGTHMYTNVSVSTTRNIISYVHVLVKGRMHFRWRSDMCRRGTDFPVVPAGIHQICFFDFGSLRTLLKLPRAVLRLCQPPLGRISTIGDGCFEF